MKKISMALYISLIASFSHAIQDQCKVELNKEKLELLNKIVPCRHLHADELNA